MSYQQALFESTALRAVNVAELISMELRPRDMILGPIIPVQGLVMAYAPRGIGKTFVGLSVGYAVASGGSFLRFTAPKALRVLYLDGEMPAAVMKERLIQIARGMPSDILDQDGLRIITPDLQKDISTDISTPRGQALIDRHLEGVSLVVADNLATLCPGIGNESEGEGWLPVQAWLLSLRQRGIAVLLIHHAAKGGQQRGTSRREDVLDTVIAMRRPSDYQPSQGARFEVHFEKARGLYGDQVKPFEAQLTVENNAATWTTKDLVDVEYQRVVELIGLGMTVREIAEETRMSRSTVGRLKKRAEAEGALGK